MNSNQPLKSSSPSPINRIIGCYTKLFINKFGVSPKVNGPWCGKLIKGLLKEHSPEGICRIIELYFEDPANKDRVFHLPNILSGWSFNKYLPHMKYNEGIYDNAEEMNKDLW